jgi:hypothetical protein
MSGEASLGQRRATARVVASGPCMTLPASSWIARQGLSG